MKQSYIIFAVVAIIAVGGLFFLMQPKSTTPSPNEQTNPVNDAAIVQPSMNPVSDNNESATSSGATGKSYTLADVSQHSQAEDCWMAIEGKVYDVTNFVSKHPGGKAILNGCGKDATIFFNERPTNDRGPHPDSAKAQLPQYYIGDLAQ